MVGQHWFKQWFVTWQHQAITWANVDPDLCHHMVSLGHNELKPDFFSHTALAVENGKLSSTDISVFEQVGSFSNGIAYFMDVSSAVSW